MCLDAHVTHHVCMGSDNYNQIDRAIAECRAEDVSSMLEYEEKIMGEHGEEVEAAMRSLEAGEDVTEEPGFNFLDFVRGFVMQKFCVYKVPKKLEIRKYIFVFS